MPPIKKNLHYQEHIEYLKEQGLYRILSASESPCSRGVLSGQAGDNRKLLFCSNNYLDLANDPRIIEAVREGVEQWGFGSGGSPLICGHTKAHEHLEERLTNMLEKEKCLIFPSGFQTNYTVLSTLAAKGDLVAIDKQVHASIIDGVRASGATVRVWPHRQTKKLIRLLERDGYNRAFIVAESLFSMEGDWADLADLIEIKKHYGAILVLDEAHAFGCVGPMGKGKAAAQGLLRDVDVFIATFSKALGGSGGFAAGTEEIIDYLINQARGFIFSTAIPAVNCLAAEAALDVIQEQPQRAEKLADNASYFRGRCRELGLNIGESESHIVPVILGHADRTVEIAHTLCQKGYLVAAVRPPTVSPGSSRLRISLMSRHSREDIDGLCKALEETVLPFPLKPTSA